MLLLGNIGRYSKSTYLHPCLFPASTSQCRSITGHLVGGKLTKFSYSTGLSPARISILGFLISLRNLAFCILKNTQELGNPQAPAPPEPLLPATSLLSCRGTWCGATVPFLPFARTGWVSQALSCPPENGDQRVCSLQLRQAGRFTRGKLGSAEFSSP